MGLSINYSGSFNKQASLSEMIEEVKDIVEIYKWKYTIYEEQFPANSLGKDNFIKKIYGISFTPPECFNKHASLSEMIEEVKDIVEIYKWKYTIYEEQFPTNSFGKKTFNKKIYGISFTPPECETVSLSFLSNGKMSCWVRLKYYGDSTNEAEQQYLNMLSVKTQYAGIEIHKLIVHLLKYLSKKYFANFKVDDEGKYWESGDEKLLNKIFGQYNDLLQNVSFGLQNCPIKKGETFEQYFDRILKRSHYKKKNTD